MVRRRIDATPLTLRVTSHVTKPKRAFQDQNVLPHLDFGEELEDNATVLVRLFLEL